MFRISSPNVWKLYNVDGVKAFDVQSHKFNYVKLKNIKIILL